MKRLPARLSALLTPFALFLSLGLLPGCGGNDHANLLPVTTTPTDTDNSPVVSTSRTFNGLEFTLSTPKTFYTQGEAVPLTLTVRNVGTQSVTYDFSNGISNAAQITHAGKVIGMPVDAGTEILDTSLSLEPGETKTFSHIWNQKVSGTGTQAAPGQYQAVSWLPAATDTAPQTNLASGPVTFLVTNSTSNNGPVTTTVTINGQTFEAVAGEVLVQLLPASDTPDMVKQLSDFGQVIGGITTLHEYHLRLRADLSVEEAVTALNKLPGVYFAEPNGIFHSVFVPGKRDTQLLLCGLPTPFGLQWTPTKRAQTQYDCLCVQQSRCVPWQQARTHLEQSKPQG